MRTPPSSCRTARPSRQTRRKVISKPPRPGHRAPHLWLADGRSTIDLFGNGYVLLRFDQSIDVENLVAAARNRGLDLKLVDIDDDTVAAAYERSLVLVRPDARVCWRNDVASERLQAEQLIAKIADD